MDEVLIEQYRQRGLTPADGIWENRPGKVWYSGSQSPAVLDIHAMRQLAKTINGRYGARTYVVNGQFCYLTATTNPLEDDLWRMDCQ